MIEFLHIFGAVTTLLFGLLGIVKPQTMAKWIALQTKGARGVSEMRATYGGWLVGLGGFALFANSVLVFQCLGAAWLGAAVLRTSSFYLDKSYSVLNLKVVLFELVMAIFLFA